MTPSSAVIISRADLVVRLRDHLRDDPTVTVLDATDAPPPAERVVACAQTMVAMGRAFAATPSALELIERLRASNPCADIRVLADDAAGIPTLLNAPLRPPAQVALQAASHPLTRPTRRAARYALPSHVKAIVNGARVTLVNLSRLGAQVRSPELLRPGQRVQLETEDKRRCEGLVVWSALEMDRPTRSAFFRAGIAFRNEADGDAIDRYCSLMRPR